MTETVGNAGAAADSSRSLTTCSADITNLLAYKLARWQPRRRRSRARRAVASRVRHVKSYSAGRPGLARRGATDKPGSRRGATGTGACGQEQRPSA